MKAKRIYFQELEFESNTDQFIITDLAGVKYAYSALQYDVVSYPNYVVVAPKDCDFITEVTMVVGRSFISYNCPKCGQELFASKPLVEDAVTIQCFCNHCEADLVVTTDKEKVMVKIVTED